MFVVVLPILFVVAVASMDDDPAAHQLANFRDRVQEPIGILTTSAGAPVEYQEATSTLNSDLLSNEFYVDDATSVVRERIPERVVHATGTGAFGYFEVTNDISHICKAKLFSEVGKKTPIIARFSTQFSRKGSRDTVREARGFAIKFYTEEGNLDLLGLNTPVFAFKNPSLFTPIAHILQRNPVTNLPDPNILWDYLSLNPEGIFEVLYVFSDYGMPVGYKHMPAFPVHTFQVHNEDGISSYIKFHILPVAGVRNFNLTEASALAIGDPDYYGRGLYNQIANCDYPSWYLKAQILSEEDRKTAGSIIFDITKNLPLDRYPLHDIGIITLDKNPTNHFAQIEQLALCPGNLVPGIVGAPDKNFEARRYLYREAHLYRLGSNFNKISVNCPMQTQVLNYVRDGVPPVGDNGRDAPNYFPNSFFGAIAYKDKKRPKLIKIFENPPNNFKQAGEFLMKELSSEQRSSVLEVILASLCPCEEFIKKRTVKWFKIIHPHFGRRIAEGLNNCAK